MDNKTKHRILGILVVAALIVILLPFFQSKRDLSTDAAIAKAPPFPDQSVQVTADVPSSPTPVVNDHSVNEEVKQQPDDTIKATHPVDTTTAVPPIVNPAVDKKPLTPSSDNKQNSDTAPASLLRNENTSDVAANNATTKTAEKIPTVRKKVTAKKTIATIKHSCVQAPLDNNGLFKLQEAAWVIQIGTFKNKANALRVVNHLRANGYSAFIQQMSTVFGSDTRVFVGPENKQSSARDLAQKIENEMHLHGIVISYKPLEL